MISRLSPNAASKSKSSQRILSHIISYFALFQSILNLIEMLERFCHISFPFEKFRVLNTKLGRGNFFRILG